MKIFGIELVRIVEVPVQTVIEQVPVEVPVYKTFAVCSHGEQLSKIQDDIQHILQVLQTPVAKQVVMHSTKDGWEMNFGVPEGIRQRSRPEELSIPLKS